MYQIVKDTGLDNEQNLEAVIDVVEEFINCSVSGLVAVLTCTF